MMLTQVGLDPVQRVIGPLSDAGVGAPPAAPPIPPGEKPSLENIYAVPLYRLGVKASPDGGVTPDQSSSPEGYTPIQMQTAYGISTGTAFNNNIPYGAGISGDGAGQTIAVIDAGNNPSFQPTGPSFAGSALQVFDKTFDLPDPPSFGMFNQTGGTTLPGSAGANWGPEIALDIEWAHSIAPAAKIEIVEASTASLQNLFIAMETAVTKLGASVVSMSFGSDLEAAGAGSLEPFIDQTYFEPALAFNQDVTFLASAGDSGAKLGDAPLYPSISPLVVGVGGTTLNITKSNQWQSETGWSYGSDSFAPSAAGGGGISTLYPKPSFQDNDGFNSAFRTAPDVSMDADPNTGAAVYDPSDFGATTPWEPVGGTSLASPMWAGVIAIANQGRVLNGLSNFSGPTQTLPALYSIPATDYHDITIGFNFYSAGPGYDLVTGRGTPIANKLEPDLASYGEPSSVVIAYQPPATVQAGGIFGTVVEAQTASGNISFGFSGTATISLLSGPVGVTFTPVTVPLISGVAVIDGLTLDQASATPYKFQIAVNTAGKLFSTLDTTPVVVTAAAPAGTGVYYPLPVDVSLHNDFNLADSDIDSTDEMLLVYNADYVLSQGQIVLQNLSTVADKTIQIMGMGEGKSIITADGTSRDFDILGLSATLTVFFQNLTIAGGHATDAGGLVLPTGTGVGGGVLMDGGTVKMSNVAFNSNEAAGSTGASGFVGASVTGGPGGPGLAGGAGDGGAIYLAAGTLTLTNDLITGNTAEGGLGGVGGSGGLAGTLTQFGFSFFPHQIPGGAGGTGGQGGTGQGGGIFVNGGNVSITSGTISGNSAVGGPGGKGGFGGTGGTFLFPGGKGGLGGPGGGGAGGGIYLFAGSVTLNSTNLSANQGVGGVGGKGGTGGFGGREHTTAGGTFTGRGGPGGDGGRGGLGFGGGMYILNGSVGWNNTALTLSDAAGGDGGVGGPVGVGPPGEKAGTGGPGGSGAGGGIFDAAAALNLSGAVISNNSADSGGGIDIKGALTLESSTVSNNTATNGGGINITGTLVLQDTEISSNTATNNGGGINSNGNFTITEGTFSDNTANALGGAIDSSGKGTVLGTDFEGNSAQAGGAIFAAKNGTLAINQTIDPVTMDVVVPTFNLNVAEEGGAIESQGTLTITNATFTGNQASTGTALGGAVYNNQGKGTISGSTFTDNTAGSGGAIDTVKGPFTVTNSTFTGNQAVGGTGGAIDASGTLTVTGGSFAGNSASMGGALGVIGTLAVSDAAITGNAAVDQGGGIYSVGTLLLNNGTAITGNVANSGGGVWNDGNLSISDVTIANNSASRTGGGVYNSSGSVAVTSGQFTKNVAGASGGGIFINKGSLTIGNSTVSGNTAGAAGGGIDNLSATLSLNTVTVSQNTATGLGGGVNNGGPITISIVTFADNSGSSGGGLYNTASGSGTVTNATFNLNKAPSGSGGGVYNIGHLTFTNATITQNSAVSGGGIYNSLGSLTTVNATIAGNFASAAGHGGGLDVGGGSVAIYNTIVASNIRGSTTADDIFPLATGTLAPSSSFNLIGTGANGVLANNSNGNQVGISNPHLGTLADNGGPLETIALLTGSTAIDGGSNSIPGIVVPTYDERGAERGPGGINAGPTVDIGAYEASSSYLVTTPVDTVGYGSILSAVSWANKSFNDNPANLVNPAPNTVTFDSNHFFSSPRIITLSGPLAFSNTTTAEAIEGTGVANLTLSGGGTTQIVTVSTGAIVTLGGMTLTGGNSASGGAVDNSGTLNVSGVAFTANSATNSGGSIQNEASATLTVNNSSFSNDTAPQGGAIFNNGTATIATSTLSNNSSSLGGSVQNAGVLTIQNSTFSGDTSTGNAGAVGNAATGNLAVMGSTFTNDIATGAGTPQGGAIYSAGQLSIAQSTFTGNLAGNAGGAVFYDYASSPLVITDSTFTANTSATGGAIYTATMTSLSGSTLTQNSASRGGAAYLTGSLAATNSTFAANTATDGAGVYNNQGTLEFINATIAYNQASSIGGGLDLINGSTSLYNTLVALNTAGALSSQAPSDIIGSVITSGANPSANNLIASAATAGGIASGTNGNLVGVLPGIASGLANNGGPTQTIALVAGSPAIDAGSSSISGVSVPSVDQRGAVRGAAVGGGLNAGLAPDIGAYEASSSYVVSKNADTLAVGTIRTGVGWADVSTNANPANLVFPAPNTVFFSTTGTITLTGGTLALANTGATVAKTIEGPGAGLLSISGNDGAGVFSVAFGVTASITGLTITGGLAPGSGGAVDNSGLLTLSNLALTGNSANFGGGVANELTGTLDVSNSSFSQNTATTFGGAINNLNNLALANDTFTNNSATGGAALANLQGASLTINQSTLTANSATGPGGGIENLGTAAISNSSFVSNTAGSGGGISQESSGGITLTNSTIAFNSAAQGGGVSSAGPATLINVTIADNFVTGTVASSGGGLSLTTGGKAGLYNTLIAQNTAGTGAFAPASDIAVNGGGSLVPNSAFNLIGTGGAGGLVAGGNTANLVGVANPGLATTLATSGGITQTLALLAGSPAIDAGAAIIVGVAVPNIDQRGALRGPAGLNAGSTVDIGAYEATSSYLVTSTADTPDVGTIASAIGWANVNTNVNPANIAHPAPNTVVFDQSATGTFATPQSITLTAPLAITNTNTAVSVLGPVTGGLSLSGGNSVGVFTIGAGVTTTITGLTITGGSATSGGGIDNAGNLTLMNDTLSGNTAATGGAVANEATGTLAVRDSTLSSNTATTEGGAIANSGGQATVTDSTIALNSAPLGGGIFNAGTLTLINDTVAYNNATSSGGGAGLDAASGTATLFNSIVAQNTIAGTATLDDISDLVSSSSANNVIDDANSAGGLTNSVGNNQIGVSAGLAAGLADNGGSTQTIALLTGSPAIGAGVAVIPGQTVPNTDQRGALRNPIEVDGVATIDAGAFEISASYLVTNTTDALIAGSLRSAVSWADGNPATGGSPVNTIYFDPTLFSKPQTIDLADLLGTLTFSNTNVPIDVVGPGASLLTIQGDGGVGLFSVPSGVTVTLSGLTLNGGGGLSGGGILNQGTLNVSNSVLADNTVGYYGGGIYNEGGTLAVSNTTFTNNSATYGLGGAIDNSGTLTVANSTFTGGVAFEGGAIDNKDGTLTLTTSTLDSNTAIQGGDIYNNASATISGSTLSNSSAFQGGAIANDLIAHLTLVNSTIAGNHAGQNGGGINQVGILNVYSSTIADNNVAAGGAGGGVDASSGTATLYNTLVAGNIAGTPTASVTSDVSGLLNPASSFNLIGGITSGLTNGVNGNLVGVTKPLLGPLANNGGPTETIALLAGSPAIDAGALSIPVLSGFITPPTTDQRGALRGPAGLNAGTTVDIGAYEASSSYQVTTSADSAAAVGTLRSAVSWADANENFNPANIAKPAANTIVFTTTQPIMLTGGALVLSNSITPISIVGPGANVLTVSGGDSSQVFQITSGTTARIAGLTITGGAAESVALGGFGSGGGLDNSGNLTLSSDAISGNAAIDGGGFSNEIGATASLVDSTVSNNSGSEGGGIYNAGTLTVSDSTIAGNSATQEGGGVVNFSIFTAVSATIAQNSVANGGTGGGLENVGGSAGLFDSIVAQNAVVPLALGQVTYNNIGGTVAPASSFNLIGSAGAGGLTSANSNLIVSDSAAGLGTLANNQGTTPTIALLAGSPAIGAGSTTITGVTVPATDQRGSVRPTSAIDIGAYQSGTFTPAPAIVINTTTTTKPTTGTSSVPTTSTKTVTPPVVVTATVATPVAPSTTTVVKTAAKAASKLKVKVTPKKAHPGAGSAKKFHKPAVVKTSKHVATAKGHPAAHAKKK